VEKRLRTPIVNVICPSRTLNRSSKLGCRWGTTPPPEAGVHYDFRFASLAELAVVHRAEQSGG